jgi:hypothetical protein
MHWLATIVQSVQRRATNWKAWDRVPAGARDVSLLNSVQTGSRGEPVFTPGGWGGGGVKRPETEVDYLPPPSAVIKQDGAIPPLPQTSRCVELNYLSTATALHFYLWYIHAVHVSIPRSMVTLRKPATWQKKLSAIFIRWNTWSEFKYQFHKPK